MACVTTGARTDFDSMVESHTLNIGHVNEMRLRVQHCLYQHKHTIVIMVAGKHVLMYISSRQATNTTNTTHTKNTSIHSCSNFLCSAKLVSRQPSVMDLTSS